ncbi:MAG: tetratricopeptide repeat protein, partial [Candidatus Melainabacteria bacterium]|nr:tetratricopeptide repeat protein [Candidatus Melainabacteria bacterium]
PNFAPAHRRLAQVLADGGNTSEATKEFQEALKWSPKDVTARVEYAQFLEKQGKKADAITEYKKALEINPNSKIAQEGISKLSKTQ